MFSLKEHLMRSRFAVVSKSSPGGREPLAGDVTSDGCVNSVANPWTRSPNNAVGRGRSVFRHDLSPECR
jgi:hypothetical protein